MISLFYFISQDRNWCADTLLLLLKYHRVVRLLKDLSCHSTSGKKYMSKPVATNHNLAANRNFRFITVLNCHELGIV